MNDQQKISRRNYDESAKRNQQAASDAFKRHNEQHQKHVNNYLKGKGGTGTNKGSGAGIIIIIALMAAAFLVFVLVMLGTK